jgi:hemerythrin-like domain-containing protein
MSGPKTCDASGMVEAHRMFQHAFDEAGDLVGGVAAGDTEHAAAVASQIDLISETLHAHHDAENERLWDILEERAPSCRVHVRRMKEQHESMLGQLADLGVAASSWKTTASPEDAARVRAGLRGMSLALAEHFPDEETTIIPTMEHVVSESEEKWFADEGRRSIPKGQMWNMLGAILATQPDGGRSWLKTHMPAPGRLAWRLVGARRYARYRAELEGR